MTARNLRKCGLKRVDVVRSDIAPTVANQRETADFKPGQIAIVTEKSCRLRREAETLRIELAFMLADVLLKEARESDSRVENHRRRECVSMVVAESVVLPGQEVPGRSEAVDHARPVAARLQPVVVSVAEEELLLLTQRLIKTVALRVEGVGARLTADEIVPPLRVARLVGQGIELQICFGYRAYQACRDHVARRAGGLCLVR